MFLQYVGTDGAFSRIAQAIEVLEALTKGDTKKSLPSNKGFLSSETNEIGQLSSILGRWESFIRNGFSSKG